MMPRTQRDKLYDLIRVMNESGVTDRTMLQHFFDYLPADECIEILLDLAVECDFDDEDMEYFQELVE